ncbi:Hypothetical predicted protein [Podarcis lilfordi]|uniref:Uncharacterized protein n=1 Tax=Podarcis lilfordi TaxID=74358 RepID=A0AA35LKG3_9SAUR|nr:Hypothetical predicted protein [Podarcis lilfordi]
MAEGEPDKPSLAKWGETSTPKAARSPPCLGLWLLSDRDALAPYVQICEYITTHAGKKPSTRCRRSPIERKCRNSRKWRLGRMCRGGEARRERVVFKVCQISQVVGFSAF